MVMLYRSTVRLSGAAGYDIHASIHPHTRTNADTGMDIYTQKTRNGLWGNRCSSCEGTSVLSGDYYTGNTEDFEACWPGLESSLYHLCGPGELTPSRSSHVVPGMGAPASVTPGTCLHCTFSDPIPALLNQKLWPSHLFS